ncbi:MAG: methyltransferase domain-containing protein [Gammaproteobacteria bacterium]|nr:methyltransferase domain-containing protein [Gammaproteobacteria bacterium]
MNPIYKPEIFEVESEPAAKAIILTPEGSTTDERWAKETPYLIEDICSFIKPDQDTKVVDFGCGIGRISKELIAKSGCAVLGLDISQSMLELAVGYVSSPRFRPVTRPYLKNMIHNDMRVDACVSLWVLQHCPKPLEEIALIKSILKDDGYFYILNNIHSAIPTNMGWVSDGVDIQRALENNFKLESYSQLPAELTTEHLSNASFIGKFRKH